MEKKLFQRSIKISHKTDFGSDYINDRIKRFIRNTEFDSRYIALLFKASADNDRFWRNVGRRCVIDLKNPQDINNYVKHVINNFNGFTEWYNGLIPEKIHFQWIIANDLDYKKYTSKISIQSIVNTLPNNIKSYLDLPFDIDYYTWGNKINSQGNQIIINNVTVGKNIETIIVKNLFNKFIVIIKFNDNTTINFTDFKHNNDLYSRTTTDGKKYYFDSRSNPLFYFENYNSNDLIDIIKPNTNKHLNICTLDIETYIDNKEHKVLCICFYDGETGHKFYINDYKSSNHLLDHLFETIFQPKNHDKSIFIHNGSSFDLVFLLNYLAKLTNTAGLHIEPIYRDGKFMNLSLSYLYNSNRYTIHIKDSYLILQSSLAKLAKQFKLEDKGIFPYSFPNKNNLDYIGKVPKYSFFDKTKLTLSQYLEYKSSFSNSLWNLRNEVLKYCELDCILLYDILKNFNDLIFDLSDINIDNTYSLPSLAFKIYRSKFMPSEEKIDISSGEIIKNKKGKAKIVGSINIIGTDLYDELKESYYGGHVDMYIPAGPIAKVNGFAKPDDKAIVPHNNKYIYHYDVNSLYPTVMKDYKYPNKLFAKFIGDIRYMDIYKNLYNSMLGIYNVVVTAPFNIKHPILPFKNDNFTIFPTGTWTGMYCSEELKNAEKYGYKFEILSGYLFTSEDLFSDYVETFYKVKENLEKDSPMYLIAKMLLNSLYGRFGINPNLEKHIIASKKDIDNKLKTDTAYLDDLIDLDDFVICTFDNSNTRNVNSNVAIASFVTAYARILMSKFMNLNHIKLFYTDTDSVFTDKPLDKTLVDSKKLGYLKLEDKYKFFCSIGPKNWIGVSDNNHISCKLKGSKVKINYLDFLSLLSEGNTKTLNHVKWFKDFTNSCIIMKDTPHILKSTDNKRFSVKYNGVIIGTKSFHIIAKYIRSSFIKK